MSWKEQLLKFEESKNWEAAISLMQDNIAKNGNDIEAYLSMCYLLMNLLVEEDYDFSKRDYYANLLKYYFNGSVPL